MLYLNECLSIDSLYKTRQIHSLNHGSLKSLRFILTLWSRVIPTELQLYFESLESFDNLIRNDVSFLESFESTRLSIIIIAMLKITVNADHIYNLSP